MGAGRGRARSGQPRRRPSGARGGVDPPPAPTVTTSIIGTLTGNGPTRPSVVRCGLPPSITATSVLVPPPSSVRTLENPAAVANIEAPSAPAAGPPTNVPLA